MLNDNIVDEINVQSGAKNWRKVQELVVANLLRKYLFIRW